MPVECFINNFDAIIPALIQEMEKEVSDIKRVYVINGISKLKEKLSEKNLPLYEKFFNMFKENENTILIIADNYMDFQRLELESWYDEVIDTSRGIWLGEGIGEQNIINTNSINYEYRSMSYPDMAFLIDDNKALPIKKVVIEKEDEDNEK